MPGSKKLLSKILTCIAVSALILTAAPTGNASAATSGLKVSAGNKPTVSWDAIANTGINAANWTEKTPAAEWSGRFSHASLVFDNKIWVLGGNVSGAGIDNDVWYSSDGISWTLATEDAGWSPRGEMGAAVYDGKMWVAGGSDGVNTLADVWYSENGVDWTMATSDPGWDSRSSLGFVDFNNKLWVIGGSSGSGGIPTVSNDVWYSENGVDWTMATSDLGWGNVIDRTITTHRTEMIALGGLDINTFETRNDIWSSSDGTNWQKLNESAAWSPRFNPAVISSDDDNLWLLAGVGVNSSTMAPDPKADVWHSADGIGWSLVTDSPAWSERIGNTAVLFDQKLWLMGGTDFEDFTNYNDVYSTTEFNLSHYKLCWGQNEASCSNSAEVAQPGTDRVSYTFSDALKSGIWYFTVYAVDSGGGEYILGDSVRVEITPGMPEAGSRTTIVYLAIVLALVFGLMLAINKLNIKRMFTHE